MISIVNTENKEKREENHDKPNQTIIADDEMLSSGMGLKIMLEASGNVGPRFSSTQPGARTQPDGLEDIRMPEGCDWTKLIKEAFPEVKVGADCDDSFQDTEYIVEAASGYLLKDSSPEATLTGLKSLCLKKSWWIRSFQEAPADEHVQRRSLATFDAEKWGSHHEVELIQQRKQISTKKKTGVNALPFRRNRKIILVRLPKLNCVTASQLVIFAYENKLKQ